MQPDTVEDEIGRIWAGDVVYPRDPAWYNEDEKANLERKRRSKAIYDYEVYRDGKARDGGASDNYIRMCTHTAAIIKEHLMEAMTSYSAYLREWGKLLMKGNER